MNYAHNFFREIMWRSSKDHVSGELQLPPQEECFSWLIFSSIEEYFYKKQHATCMDHAHQIIRSLRNDVNRKESTSGTLFTKSIIQVSTSILWVRVFTLFHRYEPKN